VRTPPLDGSVDRKTQTTYLDAVIRVPPDSYQSFTCAVLYGRLGAWRPVPASDAERPVSVRSGDLAKTRGNGWDAPKPVIRRSRSSGPLVPPFRTLPIVEPYARLDG